MKPIIEIITSQIMYNNIYNSSVKNEYINIMNRISFSDKQIEQYRRSMDYILLYNLLNEELKFTIDRQQYFNNNLKENIKYIMNDFMNNRIKLLNNFIIDL